MMSWMVFIVFGLWFDELLEPMCFKRVLLSAAQLLLALRPGDAGHWSNKRKGRTRERKRNNNRNRNRNRHRHRHRNKNKNKRMDKEKTKKVTMQHKYVDLGTLSDLY